VGTCGLGAGVLGSDDQGRFEILMDMILPWMITIGVNLIYVLVWADLWITTREVEFTYQ